MSARFARSSESVAFEQMWLQLPREQGIPERRDFHPRWARRFLRHIVLAQVPSGTDPAIRIRLVGDAIRVQVRAEMIGFNYLDFLEDENHKVEAAQQMWELFEQPCGHWWVAPVHYERDFSQHWEITTFPLAASESDPAAVLAFVNPLNTLVDRRKARCRVITMEAPVQFEVIGDLR